MTTWWTLTVLGVFYVGGSTDFDKPFVERGIETERECHARAGEYAVILRPVLPVSNRATARPVYTCTATTYDDYGNRVSP